MELAQHQNTRRIYIWCEGWEIALLPEALHVTNAEAKEKLFSMHLVELERSTANEVAVRMAMSNVNSFRLTQLEGLK